MKKNNNALFYTCSLIEYMSRKTNNYPKDVIDYLGDDLERIYNYEDVFHCEPIEKVSDEFIKRSGIVNGNHDYISKCKYLIPDYWDIGKVFERLIEDCYDEKDVFRQSGRCIIHGWQLRFIISTVICIISQGIIWPNVIRVVRF